MNDIFSFNLNDRNYNGGHVVLWMQRDQRVRDNRALIFACDLAEANRATLSVVFCLADGFTNAADVHYQFMLDGLRQVAADLAELNIPFHLLYGEPPQEICRYAEIASAGCVVTDFLPMKIAMRWKSEAADTLQVPLIEVDAHNIVPCRVASPKKEYAAATFRHKINKLLPQYLTELRPLKITEQANLPLTCGISFGEAYEKFGCEYNLPTISGEMAANAALADFTENRLNGYAADRNDPNMDAQSGLSPYFHFGQLAPQRAALAAMSADAPEEDKAAFLEELIVRRELADNYCFYNENYDSVKGADNWALKTIEEHRDDTREYIYGYDQLRLAHTHDDLWNAAQAEMVQTGKMHGYMRMYWAKKILEWTPDAETAFKYAVLLNDTYSLDGRDPNGYVGVAWSVCSVHDRAWRERPVFGKIRYMNYNGCRSKFDVKAYIDKQKRLP